jgi:type IV pilus assembly protein PilX
MKRSYHFSSQQHGLVLVVALLMLVTLTLLGIAASKMVISEERMSRYLREYNIAYQAAESALRDARDDIDGIDIVTGLPLTTLRIDGGKGFSPECLYAMCSYDITETTFPWKDAAKLANAAEYGRYSRRSALPKSGVVGVNATGARDGQTEAVISRYDTTTVVSPVSGVSQQPIYLVEAIPDLRPGTSLKFGGIPKVVYRTTVQAFGADPNTSVRLQEIYQPLSPSVER